MTSASWLAGVWPDLDLVLAEDRGADGQRFTVGGALTGTAEIWWESFRGGVIVHLFLRSDDARPDGARESVRRTKAAVAALWNVKDQVAAG